MFKKENFSFSGGKDRKNFVKADGLREVFLTDGLRATSSTK